MKHLKANLNDTIAIKDAMVVKKFFEKGGMSVEEAYDRLNDALGKIDEKFFLTDEEVKEVRTYIRDENEATKADAFDRTFNLTNFMDFVAKVRKLEDFLAYLR